MARRASWVGDVVVEGRDGLNAVYYWEEPRPREPHRSPAGREPATS